MKENNTLSEGIVGKITNDVVNRIFWKVDLQDGTYELTEIADFNKYAKHIWRILQRSYKKIGGFKTYDSIQDMTNLMSLAIICVRNKRIVACAIYRDDLGGQKLNGCGTIDGSNNSKQLLRTIKRVMQKLEEYTGFKTYDEFKDYANSLPKIDEEIDYRINHQDKDIAKAMETIILIGNAWEDGIRELTPNMQRFLKNALALLENYPEKNAQINGLLRVGKYYLNNMEVLSCHPFEYILYPTI